MDIHRARLDYYNKIIGKNFDLREVPKKSTLEDYYDKTVWAYHLFHSRGGAIHMAINPDGVFDEKGYLGQAWRINEYIRDGMDVLELGAGVGFNSDYLARQNKKVSFLASDKMPSQVRRMNNRFEYRSNLDVALIDYENIKSSKKFDLIFLVETFSHAFDPQKALGEIYRALKPGGRVIIFDAFVSPLARENVFEKSSSLAMKSMSVAKSIDLDELHRWIENESFSLQKEEDFSKEVLPCLLRLHDLSWRFLKRPRLVFLVRRLLPVVSKNSAAGLLMPDLFQSGAWQYKMLVLEKKI